MLVAVKSSMSEKVRLSQIRWYCIRFCQVSSGYVGKYQVISCFIRL